MLAATVVLIIIMTNGIVSIGYIQVSGDIIPWVFGCCYTPVLCGFCCSLWQLGMLFDPEVNFIGFFARTSTSP